MRVFAITECPPNEQVATHNKFEALASESEDRDEPHTLECLNRFAHYVQHGKKMSQKKTKAVKSVNNPLGTGHEQGEPLYACAAN